MGNMNRSEVSKCVKCGLCCMNEPCQAVRIVWGSGICPCPMLECDDLNGPRTCRLRRMMPEIEPYLNPEHEECILCTKADHKWADLPGDQRRKMALAIGDQMREAVVSGFLERILPRLRPPTADAR